MSSVGEMIEEREGEGEGWGDFWPKQNCISILKGCRNFCKMESNFCFVKKEKN